MALGYYGKPLVVTDSGGKDSAVCRELVRRSGVPYELIHNLTTADAPETIYYIRERFRQAEDGVTLHAQLRQQTRAEEDEVCGASDTA